MRMLRVLLVFLVLGIAWGALPARADGIADSLGGVGDPPGRTDGEPRPTAPAGRPGRAPKEGEESPAVRRLRERTRELEALVRAEEEKGLAQADATLSTAQAGALLDQLGERMVELEKRLDAADLHLAEQHARDRKDFEAKWGDVEEALRTGVRPEGMSSAQWQRKVDAYEEARARFDAKVGDARRRAASTRKARLKEAQAAVEQAESEIARLKALRADGKEDPKRERTAAWRAHQAKLALLRRDLLDHQEVLKELTGEKGERAGPILEEGLESTGFVLADALLSVRRQITLSGQKMPPTNRELGLGSLDPLAPDAGGGGAAGDPEPDPGDGLGSLPDWMKERNDRKGLSERDFRKAQRRSAERHLEDARDRQKNMASIVKAEDDAELSELEDAVELRDRPHASPETRARLKRERQAKLDKRRQELEASRAERTKKRKAELEAHAKHLEKKVEQFRKKEAEAAAAAGD